MERLKRVLVGVETDPAVVGAARAFVLYALPLGVGALVAWLGAVHDPRWLWLGALVPLIRALEGAILDQLKPQQNAVDPPQVAGGASPDLLH